MAGSNQAVNLGGMLSQIGNTLGKGVSQETVDKLGGNITRMSMPKLDTSDPESIDAFVQWGLGSGQLTEGQATQYGWLAQKARSEQQGQKRSDALTAYKATQQQLNTIKDQREKAAKVGNNVAVEKMNEIIAGTENALEQQLTALRQDPVASQALYRDEQQDRQRQLWQRQAAREQEIAKTNARNGEITNRSNALTQAMMSGALDVSALQPLPEGATDTERAANAKKRAQLEAVQQGDLESYEHALNRYQTNLSKQQQIAKKTENGTTLTDKELGEVGLTEQQVSSYKKMLGEFGRERAGNWAMRQLQNNQSIEAKTDQSYKWTDETSKQWMKTTADIMSDVVMASMSEGSPSGVGAVLANMSEDARKDLAARVLNRLRAAGVTPTEENARAAIEEILEGRAASKGEDVDPVTDEGWFSRLIGLVSGGDTLVDMRSGETSKPSTATSEAVEYTPAQQNTIARAMELSKGRLTREQVIQRLKDNGKL